MNRRTTMRKKETRRRDYLSLAYFALAVLILIFIALSIFQPFRKEYITGAVVAQGGYITSLNLTVTQAASNWASIYGEVSEDPSAEDSPTITVAQGSVSEHNLSFNCLGEEVYASYQPISDWDSVAAGEPQAIDQYLGINNLHAESATRMFTADESFQVGDTAILAPSTATLTTNPEAGTFDLGALDYSGAIVMATTLVSDQTGFDGRTHDYQLLLPVRDEETTVYLSMDCQVPTNITPPPEVRAAPALPNAGGGLTSDRGLITGELAKEEITPAPKEELPPLPAPAEEKKAAEEVMPAPAPAEEKNIIGRTLSYLQEKTGVTVYTLYFTSIIALVILIPLVLLLIYLIEKHRRKGLNTGAGKRKARRRKR